MRDLSQLWRARLILEDGSIWPATSFGAEGVARGELVFNTALTGYQEVLTDPSYSGQVVIMTSPLIGNYGINLDDGESDRPRVAGFVVREVSRIRSNFRSSEDLDAWLKRHGVVALEGVDTRALTRRVRSQGSMRCFLTTEPMSDDALRAQLAEVPDIAEVDHVAAVSPCATAPWTETFTTVYRPRFRRGEGEPHVVAIDYGAKHTIYRSLLAVGCRVTVVPSSTDAEAVLALHPDGVFLSNGPGDPRTLKAAVKTVKALLGRVPIFGICLGHQLLALALDAEIVKMKFGHHGVNHPVKNLDTGTVEITSQNHNFAATRESVEAAGARVTHVNLNDDSVAGLAVPGRDAFSVQYHPEAAPGPHDSSYLFERFFEMMGAKDRVDA